MGGKDVLLSKIQGGFEAPKMHCILLSNLHCGPQKILDYPLTIKMTQCYSLELSLVFISL